VTVEDIRNVIVAGAKVKVVADNSGADLTRATLLHTNASQEQFGRPVQSDQMLLPGAEHRGLAAPAEDHAGRNAKVLETPTAPLAELAHQNMEL
jgi:hypothetical protein